MISQGQEQQKKLPPFMFVSKISKISILYQHTKSNVA
jgi:hypothetical protein